METKEARIKIANLPDNLTNSFLLAKFDASRVIQSRFIILWHHTADIYR